MGKIICWNKSCRPYYRVFFDDSHCVCWGVSLVIAFGERRGVELSMKEIRVEKVTGATGSRGDVFVVRTSKLVENPWKNGLFRSRYSSVTHSIDRKPRDWGLARSAYRPSGDVPCASADMACGYWFSKWRTTKSFVFLWPVWLNRIQLGMVWKISDPCTSYISKLSVTVKMWWRHKWYNGRGSASVAVAEAP